MDVIVEFLFELFFELFGEGFISLCSAFIPNKVISEKGQKIFSAVFLIIALALFIGLIGGIILLVETNGQSFWGWLLVALSVVYIIVGIALKIIACFRK